MLSRRIGSVLGVESVVRNYSGGWAFALSPICYYYFPRSYEDRSTIKKICDLKDGRWFA